MEFDVIVIGASLAGASAAHLLGTEGVSVGLFDKAIFPRRKPCGEGLSKSGVSAARRIGFWETPAPLPHLNYSGYQIFSRGKAKTLRPPRGGGITLSRELFDQHCLSIASNNPTVVTFLGSEVTSIRHDRTVHTASGSHTCRILVIADGANSVSARNLNLPVRLKGLRRMGASAIFQGTGSSPLGNGSSEVVSVFIEKDHEIYCTPLPHGKLNMSVLASFGAEVNLREKLLAPETQNQIFEALGFEGKISEPPLGRAPIGGTARRSNLSWVFLVGDAAEEFDPIGGMGMTHAFCSAELAARAILRKLGVSASAELMSEYEFQRAKAAAPLRHFTALSYAVLRGSHRYPRLLTIASSRIGKYLSNFMLPQEDAT